MCNLENPDLPESEDCFQPLTLADGSYYQQVLSDQFNITTQVQLPQDLICERCVLRWHYVAGKCINHLKVHQNNQELYVGNNWGSCGDGNYAAGCGPQETFRSCADISILPISTNIAK